MREVHAEEVHVLKAKLKKVEDKYSFGDKEWGSKEKIFLREDHHVGREGQEVRKFPCYYGGRA